MTEQATQAAPAKTAMEQIAERVEQAEAMALRSNMTEGRARMSLNGCMAGAELTSRIMAWRTAVEAQAKATDELISAKNALSAALQRQPEED